MIERKLRLGDMWMFDVGDQLFIVLEERIISHEFDYPTHVYWIRDRVFGFVRPWAESRCVLVSRVT